MVTKNYELTLRVEITPISGLSVLEKLAGNKDKKKGCSIVFTKAGNNKYNLEIKAGSEFNIEQLTGYSEISKCFNISESVNQ